jgi:hypothetical protein
LIAAVALQGAGWRYGTGGAFVWSRLLSGELHAKINPGNTRVVNLASNFLSQSNQFAPHRLALFPCPFDQCVRDETPETGQPSLDLGPLRTAIQVLGFGQEVSGLLHRERRINLPLAHQLDQDLTVDLSQGVKGVPSQWQMRTTWCRQNKRLRVSWLVKSVTLTSGIAISGRTAMRPAPS